jgi:hypothetical protein
MNTQLQSDFLAFMEQCESLHGYQLRISEAISTNSLNFDRHFTTRSELGFTLLHSSWRFSGGRVTFAGATSSYEIGADQLVAFEKHSATDFEFTEKYSATVFRKTRILVLS